MDIFYKNVIFDLDGTLIDSNYISLLTLQKTIERVENKHFEISELKRVLGLSDYDAFKTLGIKNITACYTTWKNLSMQMDDKKEVFPGVIQSLQKLKELNLTLGIVTSREKDRYYNTKIIMDYINPYINMVVTYNSTNKHKPHPAPILKWMELTNANPLETIYIGDTHHDYICAQNANIDFYLAAWGMHVSMNSKNVLYHPSEILTLIKKEL